jgi:DNA sulfur modification protein DndD
VVEGIAKRLAIVLSKITIAERGVKDEQAAIDKAQESKNSILALIERQNVGADLLLASKQYALCEKIFRIFEKGKSEYREKLKENVEKDATDLFVHLSSDKDYIGLQIHDNYGLSIIHKSGNLVPGRSSGFEHIVALSLIGALHKNAPLRGPIIMDSPFGRLDPTHKENIVKQLPDMAEQSILLAYTGEIDEQIAREALGGSLIREYRLTRISSMYTRID